MPATTVSVPTLLLFINNILIGYLAFRGGEKCMRFVGIAATGGFKGKDLFHNSLRIAEKGGS